MGLRIISGSLKGRKIKTLPGKQTRPTSDRLRESIFNILKAHIEPLHVLDLFAGSGAFGIEAISRGAQKAVFIDNQMAACSLMDENIRHCGIESNAYVMCWDISRNLDCLDKTALLFDLVFLDPPYNKDLVVPTLGHLTKSKWIDNGALIVVEHHIDEPLPKKLPLLKTIDIRRYGKILVSFLYYMV